MKVARATLVFRTIACAIDAHNGCVQARWRRDGPDFFGPTLPTLCCVCMGTVVAPLAHYEFTPYMCLQCAFIVESADGETAVQ